MSDSQAFGNYQKRKYITSPRKSYYTPKGKKKKGFPRAEKIPDSEEKHQLTLLNYYSPSSTSKLYSPESVTNELKESNAPQKKNLKRVLFDSDDENKVICLSDDEDDIKAFALHIEPRRKSGNARSLSTSTKQVNNVLKTTLGKVVDLNCCKSDIEKNKSNQKQGDDGFRKACLDLLDEVDDSKNLKTKNITSNSKQSLHEISLTVFAENLNSDIGVSDVGNFDSFPCSPTAKVEVVKGIENSADSPFKTPKKIKNNDISSISSPCTPSRLKSCNESIEDLSNVLIQSDVEISPTKSVISVDAESLVSDVDWWDESDFEGPLNEGRNPEYNKTTDRDNECKSSNYDDIEKSVNPTSGIKNSSRETINEKLEIKNTSLHLNKKDLIVASASNNSDNFQSKKLQLYVLDNDPLYYILTSPPADIAWKTIFHQSEYKNIFKNYLSLAVDEKRLYSRLFRRKFDWIRSENMKYEYISDIAISLHNLAAAGFVKFLDPVTEDLSVILNLMQLDEIKKACDLLKLSKKGKKGDLIGNVLKCFKQQSVLKFGNVSPVNKIKMEVLKILPSLIKLEDNPRTLFMSFLLISTYPHFKSRDDNRMDIVIELLFKLNNGQLKELGLPLMATPVFKSLAAFRNYEASVDLVDKLLIAKKEKKWNEAKKLILSAKIDLMIFLENPTNIVELDEMEVYKRKYTAGSNYVYAIHEGIEVLKKERTEIGISETIECLILLLSQNYFRKGSRVMWHSELAILMERKKKFDELFLTLKQALEEESLSSLGKLMLAQRCEKLIKRKHGLSVPQKDDLAKLSEMKPYRFSTNTIHATSVPNVTTSQKQMWTVRTENGRQYMGVEEVVRQHYMSSEGKSFTEGYHDEGRIIVNLALCVFWDVIYKCLDDMFHVRLQDRPLDWGSSAFYLNRSELIKEHIEKLKLTGINGIMNVISMVCTNYHGMISLISWELVKMEQLPEIRTFLECIGVNSFLNFCDYLLQSYKERSSGLPDLTLWNVNKKKCLFVEVKGPSDKLSPKQIIWLQKLNEIGIEAEVCHVHTLHTGKRDVPQD